MPLWKALIVPTQSAAAIMPILESQTRLSQHLSARRLTICSIASLLENVDGYLAAFADFLSSGRYIVIARLTTSQDKALSSSFEVADRQWPLHRCFRHLEPKNSHLRASR